MILHFYIFKHDCTKTWFMTTMKISSICRLCKPSHEIALCKSVLSEWHLCFPQKFIPSLSRSHSYRHLINSILWPLPEDSDNQDTIEPFCAFVPVNTLRNKVYCSVYEAIYHRICPIIYVCDMMFFEWHVISGVSFMLYRLYSLEHAVIFLKIFLIGVYKNNISFFWVCCYKNCRSGSVGRSANR